MPRPKNRSIDYWSKRKYCDKYCQKESKDRINSFLNEFDTVGECHETRLWKDKDGYGHIMIDGIRWISSRLSYTLNYGKIPEGKIVRHSCDNPSCIRKEHLLIGTPKENTVDKVERNRQYQPEGELNGMSKLTEKEVSEIRLDTRLQREIAFDYGVSRSNISMIKSGNRWRVK